jgi:hypothetical protein
MRNVLMISILLFGAGCSQDMLLAHSTPAYAQGYREGCQTGTAAASNISGTVVRNEKRYKNEPDYQQGWDAGQNRCNARFDTTIPTGVGSSMVYDASGVVGGGGHDDFGGGQNP